MTNLGPLRNSDKPTSCCSYVAGSHDVTYIPSKNHPPTIFYRKICKDEAVVVIGNKLPSPSSSCSPRIADLDHLMILRSQPPAQSELGGVVPLETLPNAPCHQCPGSHHSPSAPEKRNKGPHSPWIWHQKLSRKKNGPAFKKKTPLFTH